VELQTASVSTPLRFNPKAVPLKTIAIVANIANRMDKKINLPDEPLVEAPAPPPAISLFLLF
jgi:hypothetical protein